MDPTTSAHVDPFGGHQSDLTSRQPDLNETSGLTTATVPSTGSSGLGNAPQLGAAHHSSHQAGFNNPFLSQSTQQQPPIAPTNPIDQNYPDTQVYPTTHDNSGFSSGNNQDFADIHARSTSTTSASSTGDRGYSDSQLNQTSQSIGSTAQSAADRTSSAANQASNKASDALNQASNKTTDTLNQASNKASDALNQASNKASQLSNQASQKANEAATGIRQRVKRLSVDLNNAADHPAVKNAKGAANNQIAQIREQLGRSETVRELEKRTGIDRVALVFGGALSYFLLIPLNVLGLALPITQLLTILPATYLAALVLDKPGTDANDQKVKSLLSYFVVLGAIQTVESLMAGFLERKIPQYYTVKLLFLAYLLHPRTQGANQVHEQVFRPLLATAQNATKQAPPGSGLGYQSQQSQSTYSAPRQSSTASTPPTSKASLSNVSSPTQPQGFQTMAANIPIPGETEHIIREEARGEGYSVVREVHLTQ